ncbi:MAG: beta-ketoacyl-[acyl-carrier-protein] synthase family protein [Candidatus Omnitrophica bacterium]|nr:beta-ketoacyl-[acyl-carrier-protein] synthase family protein [Candidatus Omnitrophota bacterium]
MRRRVVITGMGVVSPIGNTAVTFLESLKNGRSGEGAITSFDATNFPVKRAFEVKQFDAKRYKTHMMDPFIQYAMGAATEAVEDACFDMNAVDHFRIGLAIGSSKGGVHTIDRFKERFEKHPSAILGARIYTNAVPNFAAQWIARRWDIGGPAKCYVAACATGTVGIIEGIRMVEAGDVDYCLAGASDASIVPLMLAGYRNMKALSPDAIRPFDLSRNGFVIGEGAGIVFLETIESAQARNAAIYGEVAGYAYGNDCYHPVQFDPCGDALARTLDLLFRKCALSKRDVDYVNLHGTGTVAGDLYEARQLRKFFGEKTDNISMSATKSMTGHMLGASGAVELIAAILAIKEDFVPPTIGIEKQDPECDIDITCLGAKERKIKAALSLSMGFGGHIATIAIKKI